MLYKININLISIPNLGNTLITEMLRVWIHIYVEMNPHYNNFPWPGCQLSACNCRALNPRNLGPKFDPIPKAKKYGFFPIPEENSQFDQVCLVQENLRWINAKYNKNLLKLKKQALRIVFISESI